MIRLIFALLLLTAIPAQAEDWSVSNSCREGVYQSDRSDWSRADICREAVYLLFHVADWRQTLYGAQHPDLYVENNPFLGRGRKQPDDSAVNRYFTITAGLHIAFSHYLPELGSLLPENWQRALYVEHWRKVFQYSTTAGEAMVVIQNNGIGWKIFF